MNENEIEDTNNMNDDSSETEATCPEPEDLHYGNERLFTLFSRFQDANEFVRTILSSERMITQNQFDALMRIIEACDRDNKEEYFSGIKTLFNWKIEDILFFDLSCWNSIHLHRWDYMLENIFFDVIRYQVNISALIFHLKVREELLSRACSYKNKNVELSYLNAKFHDCN